MTKGFVVSFTPFVAEMQDLLFTTEEAEAKHCQQNCLVIFLKCFSFMIIILVFTIELNASFSTLFHSGCEQMTFFVLDDLSEN